MADNSQTTVGYMHHCLIVPRKGDTLLNESGRPTMRGYAIVPLEDYYKHIGNAIEVFSQFARGGKSE